VTGTDFGSEDLQRRFTEPPEGASPAGDCPEAETFLDAVRGRLPPRENRDLADHAAICPSCTVAWKLARDYADEAGLEIDAEPSRGVSPIRRWAPAAAALAAVVLLAVVLIPWQRETEPTAPVLRTPVQETIESLVPVDARLPAAEFTLRWSPGPQGARYAIRVTDRRLEHLAGAAVLDRPEYTVPEAALSGLEPGSRVLWQVETVLPDGRRIVSATFATEIE
jgi:hypothetical protein